MDQKKVGEFLSQLRREKGLSQKELAEKIGVTDKTVSRWETGSYMPDIDTFTVLSEFYNVLINELISGERIEQQAVIQRSEENVKDIAKGFKRKLKTVYTVAVTALICLSLVFLSVCVAMFLNARKNMLYPIEISDGQSYKTYKGALEIVKNNLSADLFEDTVGETTFAFAMPQGYVKNKIDPNNSYVSDKGYILVNSRKEADYPLPMNLALSQYYSQNNITRVVDKVVFAYDYNLEDVSVFDSENEIEIAGGCRYVRSYISNPNNAEDAPGCFYYIIGDYRGWILSDKPEGSDDMVWHVMLENDDELFSILLVKTSIRTGADVAEFISTFDFR